MVGARGATSARVASLALMALFASAGGAGFGCASRPELRTTLFRAADIEAASGEAVQSLAMSSFMMARTKDSPEAVLQPQTMVNLSDNRLSPGDQWAAMSKVVLSPNMLGLLESKNVTLQMPAFESTRLARAGVSVSEPKAQVVPTHLFTATLRSLSRATAGGARQGGSGQERKDVFLVEYTIVEVESRRVEWSGESTIARVAHGSLID